MELVDYLRVIRRRYKVIALAVLACLAGALAVSFSATKQYDSTIRILVTGSSGLSEIDELSTRNLAVQRAQAFAQIAPTLPAVDAAMDGAGLAPGVGRPTSVTAVAQPGTPFLIITVRDTDPRRAQAIAEAYVPKLPGVLARLDQAPSNIQQNLSVLDPAGLPLAPSSPDPVRDGGVGLALGLALGLSVAFLREALDRSYKDPDKLEDDTGLTVLGVIPEELPGQPMPLLTKPNSNRAESYRQVRTNIQFAGPEHTLKTIVITSATQGEGKTTVATNLAVAFARTGQTVVIVDADMRRPQVANALGLSGRRIGLAEVLAGQVTVDDAFLRLEGEDRVTVLASGESPGNPSELLGSLAMKELLAELGRRFDVVLVDCPPVLPVTDPLVLSVMATGVVVVVRLGATSKERLRRTLASIGKLNVPLLGLVANGAVASGDAAYGYAYGYGYGRKGSRAAAALEPQAGLRPVGRDGGLLAAAPAAAPAETAVPSLEPAPVQPPAYEPAPTPAVVADAPAQPEAVGETVTGPASEPVTVVERGLDPAEDDRGRFETLGVRQGE